MPRPLSHRERDALNLLLSADFAGAPELRVQANSVEGLGEKMIVELIVDQALPKAIVVGRVPVQAVVAGDGYDGGLLLFVDDGRLSALEYWWVTEDMPAAFPPIEAVGAPIA